MVLWEEVRRKRSQALIPSLCGILVYNDETSSVTSKELAGKLPMVRSLLRKSLVSLTKDGIGETKRRLKDRFNEHHRTIDNPNNKSKPTTAAEHFLSSPNHTANDMILIPIEKIFSNRDSIRKAREAFLIQKGRTIDPDGLNICEETY